MPNTLPIQPIDQQLDSTLPLPGSKSITNRALVLAALAEGTTKLEGALFSRDTQIMLKALGDLGFDASSDETSNSITVKGLGGDIPVEKAILDVGNAGTAARFLPAFLANKENGEYRIDGDEAMRKRPIAGLVDALTALGAAEFVFHGEPNHFPLTIRTKGYQNNEAAVDSSASSQILSALLLSAPASNAIKLSCKDVRPSYVNITLKVREAFGAAPVEASEDGVYDLPATSYQAPASGSYIIEPDVSAASYFLALTLIHGGTLHIPNLNSEPLQGDAHFIDVLEHHGLSVDADSKEWTTTCNAPEDVQRDHREIDFNSISDTFLTYAAIAPLLGGSVKISGIGHTRHQETDRVAGMAEQLSKLGQLVKEEDDALTIMPKPNELRARALKARNAGQLLNIDTYDDHRFAMSFAVLASFDLLGDGQPWLAINDPDCCAKTFPNFFDTLNSLRNA